jgi:hypothetical protein
MNARAEQKSDRMLEISLLSMFFIHGFAMLATALILLPGCPGGQNIEVAARMHYVASHPTLWRIGWGFWQMTAIADLFFAIALVRTKWIPKLPALLSLLFTLLAIIPDQAGQFFWVTKGIAIAGAGDLAQYLPFETRIFHWIAFWGSIGYTFAAICWSVCFATAGVWRTWLTYLSIVAWSIFLYISVAPLLGKAVEPPAIVVAAGNAIAFVLLLIFLIALTELVLRKTRHDDGHGRLLVWRMFKKQLH